MGKEIMKGEGRMRKGKGRRGKERKKMSERKDIMCLLR